MVHLTTLLSGDAPSAPLKASASSLGTLCLVLQERFFLRPGDGALPAPRRGDAGDGAGVARGFTSLSHERPRCRAQQSASSTFLSYLSDQKIEASGSGVA